MKVGINILFVCGLMVSVVALDGNSEKKTRKQTIRSKSTDEEKKEKDRHEKDVAKG